MGVGADYHKNRVPHLRDSPIVAKVGIGQSPTALLNIGDRALTNAECPMSDSFTEQASRLTWRYSLHKQPPSLQSIRSTNPAHEPTHSHP